MRDHARAIEMERRAPRFWRRGGLLTKFLLILTPLFLLPAIPGIGFLVYYAIHENTAALAVRFGNLAGRVAAALARHDPSEHPQVARDLVQSMASDRALICADVHDSAGTVLVPQPPVIGCSPSNDGMVLTLPIGDSGDYTLSVRFSDAEISAANRLQKFVGVSVIGVAFVLAVLTSTVGLRFIVSRPLRLLLSAIEHAAATGERALVDLDRRDEPGSVIAAFNELQVRDIAWEGELKAANEQLRESQADLTALNKDLEQRVLGRTAELEAQKVQAETANRAKSEFLANMSHELRTPLNAIIGFSEIMADDSVRQLTSKKLREYAGDILSSGRHLLDVINDILDIAKIEAGEMRLDDQDIVLGDVVDAAVRLICERAEHRGITLSVTLPDPIPRLRADQRACKQIMINLLSNAVKFTQPNGRVEVSARVEHDGALRLSVSDTGIGIATEHFERVLQPFLQIDGSLGRKYTGTGLGLPLVKSLIELHGGSLELASELDQGTTVSLRFPADRVLEPGRQARRLSAAGGGWPDRSEITP